MKTIKNKLIAIFSILISVIIISLCYCGYDRSKLNMIKIADSSILLKLESDVNALSSYINYEYGNIELKDNILISRDGIRIDGNNDLVDRITEDLGDVATIFRKEGDNFVRVSTNVKDKNGKRLLGTKLDTESESYKSVINGKSFKGGTTIEGKEYSASYVPLKDENGAVIGLIFVGTPTTEILSSIDDGLSTIRRLFIVLGIFFMMVGILVTYIIGKRITKNLKATVEFSKNIYDLDVSKDVPENLVNLEDEIGDLGKTLQVVVSNLRDFMSNTYDLSNNVSEYSKDLMYGMEQVNETANEISKVVVQISEGATNQAKDTEKGAQQINELGSSIEANRDLLKLVTEEMTKVGSLKAEGLYLVELLSKEAENTNATTIEIIDVINNTNSKAKEIQNASKMIKEISEQTNLLALNAAIEAARAGEEGRGFAVVADEVRKLAEESNKFTEEIEKIIHELTDRTESAVLTMDKMQGAMKREGKIVKDTAEKFYGISTSVEESINSLSSLNSSSSEMEKQKNSMIDIMQNLSAISEEYAASTEEVAASVQEQTATIAEFNNAVVSMKDLAEDMKTSISKFKY